MQLDFEFEAGNNKIYKVESIYNSTIYAKKLALQQLLKALLFRFVEKLSQKRKYLKVCIDYSIFLKTYYCLRQK